MPEARSCPKKPDSRASGHERQDTPQMEHAHEDSGPHSEIAQCPKQPRLEHEHEASACGGEHSSTVHEANATDKQGLTLILPSAPVQSSWGAGTAPLREAPFTSRSSSARNRYSLHRTP